MSKYSRELKLTTAKACLEGKSSRVLARELSIPSRQIRYWAQVYAIHGTNTFLPNSHASSAKTKLRALKLMWTNDWSLNHTSAVLNQSSSGSLSVWLKAYNEFGLKGLERSSVKGRPSMKASKTVTKKDNEMTLEELKEELAYLRAENAVLKKWEELKQAKRRQTKKKR
ncbi:MAG: helix-turn-helix domain-containing protein [Psychrobium sp.]